MRWADRLHPYNFNVVYRQGKENNVADMLSRSGQSSSTSASEENDSAAYEQIISTIFATPVLQAITQNELGTNTKLDQTLDTECQYISSGCPKQRPFILSSKVKMN